MKRTFADAILFFLAMNFIGVLCAVGVMTFLGKLNKEKLQDFRAIALDEVIAVKPEVINDYKSIEEKYNKLKREEEIRTKQDGLTDSYIYDNQISALKKREEEIRQFEYQIKTESEISLKRWQEVNRMLEEIKKRQADYAQVKKDDLERNKDEKLRLLLKRYDSMEPINVAMALIHTDIDPKLNKPIIEGKEEDPRIAEAAFYLREMKPNRAAEIMETMGPLWTSVLQKYMEKMPARDTTAQGK